MPRISFMNVFFSVFRLTFSLVFLLCLETLLLRSKVVKKYKKNTKKKGLAGCNYRRNWPCCCQGALSWYCFFFLFFFLVTPYPPTHAYPFQSPTVLFPCFFWNVPVRFFHALAPPLLCMYVCMYILYITNPPHKHLFWGESSQIDRLLSQVVV